MTVSVPRCSLCEKPKTALPDKTKGGLTVFVCTEKVGKDKKPCDGEFLAHKARQ